MKWKNVTLRRKKIVLIGKKQESWKGIQHCTDRGKDNHAKGKKKKKKKKEVALTGNRTRASRVAGENSTTEPSVLPVEKLSLWQTKTESYMYRSR